MLATRRNCSTMACGSGSDSVERGVCEDRPVHGENSQETAAIESLRPSGKGRSCDVLTNGKGKLTINPITAGFRWWWVASVLSAKASRVQHQPGKASASRNRAAFTWFDSAWHGLEELPVCHCLQHKLVYRLPA